jgi:basic membrane protein A
MHELRTTPRTRTLDTLRALTLVALIGVVSWGCGSDEPSEATFSVALLTPGSIADGGWNAGAYAGLEQIRDVLGAEISHVETRTPVQFEESFRDYANRGYDLVFGHGFEYQDAAALVAAEFPDTIFVTTSGNTVLANLAPMVFELEQATYLCGYLAGRMTDTGKLGMIGGVNMPSIKSTFIAFVAGAEAARPDVVVGEVFLGNFDDTAAAREAALALLDEQADFLIHQANEAGRGVFQAVSERALAGQVAFAFGTNRNQNAMAPDVVIASATLDIPSALLEVARRVRDGEFVAEPIRLGMAQDIVRLEFNDRLLDRIPAPVIEELALREGEIRRGELVVPRGSF